MAAPSPLGYLENPRVAGSPVPPEIDRLGRRGGDGSTFERASRVMRAGAGGKLSGKRPGATPEDIALVERLLGGDESAFAALVDLYHGRLIRLAMVFVSDRAAAEEVVQETWLGVLNGLRTFEGRSALKTWIFRILTNRAKTRGVRDARFVSFSSLADADPEGEPAVDPDRFNAGGKWRQPPRLWTENTPEKLLLRREAMTVLEKAIAELPPNQRAVVTLRDVEGLDSEEVCHILAISETNQRVLLHRGRSKLRRALARYLTGE